MIRRILNATNFQAFTSVFSTFAKKVEYIAAKKTSTRPTNMKIMQILFLLVLSTFLLREGGAVDVKAAALVSTDENTSSSLSSPRSPSVTAGHADLQVKQDVPLRLESSGVADPDGASTTD